MLKRMLGKWLFPRTVISYRQGINWYMPLRIHESILPIICWWNYSKEMVKEVHKEYCVEMFINKLFSIGPRLCPLITIHHWKESGVIGEMVAFRSGARLHKWAWTTQRARKPSLKQLVCCQFTLLTGGISLGNRKKAGDRGLIFLSIKASI